MDRAKITKGLSGTGLFLLSGLIALLVDEYLFPLWFDLGLRRPVESFFEEHSDALMVSGWTAVWLRLPAWLIATLWGALLGRLAEHRWPVWASVAAAGFFLVPQLWLLVLDIHPMLFYQLLRDLIAVPLIVGAAFMMARRQGRR